MIWLTMLILAAPITDDPRLQRRIDQAPKPIRDLIGRRAGCNYFAGEEAYDDDRARDLARKARTLRCTMLDKDERLIRRRYASVPDLLELLDQSRDVTY